MGFFKLIIVTAEKKWRLCLLLTSQQNFYWINDDCNLLVDFGRWMNTEVLGVGSRIYAVVLDLGSWIYAVVLDLGSGIYVGVLDLGSLIYTTVLDLGS